MPIILFIVIAVIIFLIIQAGLKKPDVHDERLRTESELGDEPYKKEIPRESLNASIKEHETKASEKIFRNRLVIKMKANLDSDTDPAPEQHRQPEYGQQNNHKPVKSVRHKSHQLGRMLLEDAKTNYKEPQRTTEQEELQLQASLEQLSENGLGSGHRGTYTSYLTDESHYPSGTFELYLRHKSHDEAMFELKNMLSEARNAGYSYLAVVHGKGKNSPTGSSSIRKEGRKLIQNDKNVESYAYLKGNKGVTLVTLKKPAS